MYYCRNCADERGWPKPVVYSRGKCEVCHQLGDCYDTPSNLLPKPSWSAVIPGVVWASGVDAQGMCITPEALAQAVTKSQGRIIPVTHNFDKLTPPIGVAELKVSTDGNYLLADIKLAHTKLVGELGTAYSLEAMANRLRPGFTILSADEQDDNGRTVTTVNECYFTEVSLCSVDMVPLPTPKPIAPMSYWQTLTTGKTIRVNDPSIVTNVDIPSLSDGIPMVSYTQNGESYVTSLENFRTFYIPR
jgi:hypothetical protein